MKIAADPSCWMSLSICIKNAIVAAWGAKKVRVVVNAFRSIDSPFILSSSCKNLPISPPGILILFFMMKIAADPSCCMNILTCIKKEIVAAWGAKRKLGFLSVQLGHQISRYILSSNGKNSPVSPHNFLISSCNCWSLFLNEFFDLY